MADAAAEIPQVSRRELLYYIWFASIAVATGTSTGFILWFARPKFREGEFGATKTFKIDELPEANAAPVGFPSFKVWLVRTDEGMLAIFKICTHLGCLYKWVPPNNRFECPCHGSKFELDGTYIEGPAPRSLDRFVVTLLDADGNELVSTDEMGSALPIPPNAVEIVVDSGNKILGEKHA